MITTEEYLGLSKKKKISLDIDGTTLEIINDLTKLFETNRTTVITNLIIAGLNPRLSIIEEAWGKMKKNKFGEKKVNQKLKELDAFRKKWPIIEEFN
jgi:hypothetical protein